MKFLVALLFSLSLSASSFVVQRVPPTFVAGPQRSTVLPAWPKFLGGKGDAVVEKEETTAVAEVDEECVVEEEKTEIQKLMQQVKDAGTAGLISYILWEWAFWSVAAVVVVLGYYEFTGHWPNFQDKDDVAKLSAEAFAFVNFARFAVPLRIGLALGTTPWVQENIVNRFFPDKDDKECKEADGETNGTNGA